MEGRMQLALLAVLLASVCGAPAAPPPADMPADDSQPYLECHACMEAEIIRDVLREGNVEALLKQFCGTMPPYARSCTDLVHGFPGLVVNLLDDLTRDICPMFSCSPMPTTLAPPDNMPAAGSSRGWLECQACGSARAISGILRNGNIEAMLKKFCGDMPPYAKSCTDLVHGFPSLVVKLLDDMTEDICPMFPCTPTTAYPTTTVP